MYNGDNEELCEKIDVRDNVAKVDVSGEKRVPEYIRRVVGDPQCLLELIDYVESEDNRWWA